MVKSTDLGLDMKKMPNSYKNLENSDNYKITDSILSDLLPDCIQMLFLILLSFRLDIFYLFLCRLTCDIIGL